MTGQEPAGAAHLRLTYPTQAEAVGRARRAVVAQLVSLGVPDDLVERAALVVSELSANAVEAKADGHFAVVVSVAPDPVEVRCAVESRGTVDDLPPRPQWGPVSLRSPRGRGLALVEAVSAAVTVRSAGPQLVIEAALR